MPNTLTKSDIIEAIQKENGYSRKQSTEATETLLEIIKQTLESGEDVMISGFGKFQVKSKKERKGRNPATGEDLTLPHRRVVTFKCSGSLRDRINNGWTDGERWATTYRYVDNLTFMKLLICIWSPVPITFSQYLPGCMDGNYLNTHIVFYLILAIKRVRNDLFDAHALKKYQSLMRCTWNFIGQVFNWTSDGSLYPFLSGEHRGTLYCWKKASLD